MANSKRSKITNIIIVVVGVLVLIPQTRLPIQIFLNRAIALVVSPSQIDTETQVVLNDYDWQLRSTSGKNIDFKTGKDKVVILNFWATWCPPCIAEMPSLQKLYDHYDSNDDVIILLVSNEEFSKIEKFKSENEYTFEVFQALSNAPSEFDVSSIPRTFVIGKSGNIIVDETGAADWNSDKVHQIIEDALKAF